MKCSTFASVLVRDTRRCIVCEWVSECVGCHSHTRHEFVVSCILPVCVLESACESASVSVSELRLCACCFYVMDGYDLCIGLLCCVECVLVFFFFRFRISPKRTALCALRFLTGQPTKKKRRRVSFNTKNGLKTQMQIYFRKWQRQTRRFSRIENGIFVVFCAESMVAVVFRSQKQSRKKHRKHLAAAA